MKNNTDIGLYFHIPFCDGKCPYCDFYSMSATDEIKTKYIDALKSRMEEWAERLSGRTVKTVYFGGGTPTLLGNGLNVILEEATRRFKIDKNAEITSETNPSSCNKDLLVSMRKSGFNRISVGMQSSVEEELKFLGRKHGATEVINTVGGLKSAGFSNFSLDMMLALQGQTKESLMKTIALCEGLDTPHISAYLLKIEDGTPFGERRGQFILPDDEAQRELYLFACEKIENIGLHQYEISNFARKGYESRHNLVYWNDDEYLGLGPAAHSFVNGKRFFFPRDIISFMSGEDPTEDGTGGDEEEYIMLRLRLTDGVVYDEFRNRYGMELPNTVVKRAKNLLRSGLLECDEKGIRLTKEGFIVSNAVIGELLK